LTKSLFVTIAGRTNAGKSSLLNLIIGEKIASVSSKPQTTRTRITGIKTDGELQMVFMDTPGLHKSKNKLSEHMMTAVRESVTDMDVILYVADCTRDFSDEECELLSSFNPKKQPVILLLNKIDLLEKKEALIEKINECNKRWSFSSIIPISVKKNDGIDIVLKELKPFAKESPHFFPDDKFTDQPEQVIASEIIREKLLRYLRDEVPHGVAVGIEQFKERNDKDILDISAVIYCERDSHKGIIIGKSGSLLKKISTAARNDLEDFFQIQVNLKCWVKVAENWRTKENMIKRFGLE
jgi:GTP-binding protein Era